MPEDKSDDDRDSDSDDSDRKSKMSFSYWGADKVTVQKPVVIKTRGAVPRRGGANAHGHGTHGGSSYGRESSANAKFGTRLVANESGSPSLHHTRPASRRTAATPVSRRGNLSNLANSSTAGDDFAKATVTRPEWNTSTRPMVSATSTTKRVRNVSQTSGAPSKVSQATTTKSPAPSEDSGVGLYRQMLAKDPAINP
jgi:hypothetical protein